MVLVHMDFDIMSLALYEHYGRCVLYHYCRVLKTSSSTVQQLLILSSLTGPGSSADCSSRLLRYTLLRLIAYLAWYNTGSLHHPFNDSTAQRLTELANRLHLPTMRSGQYIRALGRQSFEP